MGNFYFAIYGLNAKRRINPYTGDKKIAAEFHNFLELSTIVF